MPEAPHAPAQHTPAGKAERLANIAAAGKAAADRGRTAQTTEGAVEAALSVAAERAAERDAGKPSDVIRPEPVAQHKPAADDAEALPTEESAETESAAKPEKSDLAVRIKRKQREEDQRIKSDRAKLDQQSREFEAERQERQRERENRTRLERLKETDTVAWLKEVGADEKAIKRYVQAKLAEGKDPTARQALTAETQAQQALREVEELKAKLEQRETQTRTAQEETNFVNTAKAEDYPVLGAIYSDTPFDLVQAGYKAQQDFRKQFNRPASNAELLFNLECIEATKIAKATGNEKLLGAVKDARESGDLKAVRSAFGKPKATDKKSEKKPPPGPSAQSRVSQPSGDAKALDRKDLRARAANASAEARRKMANGETQFDPAYLAGSK